MNENLISGRLSWLGMALATQRNNLGGLLLRLKDAGLRAGTSFSLHKKFMHMMGQVAVDREKELSIINEIEAVERQHSMMKERRMLRCVSKDSKPKAETVVQPEDKKEEPSGLLALLGLLCLMSSDNNKNKKQKLIAD